VKASDLRQRPISQRILANTRADGDCLVWQGKGTGSGYGQISWGGRLWLVHRAIWTALRGPIPEGLTIDHLCRTKLCVFVEHMEVVTAAVNSERAGGLRTTWANRRAKTHCKHGHEFTPENTRTNSSGGRMCKECGRRSWREWAERSGRKSTRQLSPCGTRAAYARHRKAGEDCAPCRTANAEYEHSRRSGNP
jgi:hypothetical protein